MTTTTTTTVVSSLMADDRVADLLRLRSEWKTSKEDASAVLNRIGDIGAAFARENGGTTREAAAARREEGLSLADQVSSLVEQQKAGLEAHLALWPENDELGAGVRHLLSVVEEAERELAERRGGIESIAVDAFGASERR